MKCVQCDKPVFCKGLCNTHYQRQWHNNNREAVNKRIREQRARKKAADPNYHQHLKEQNKQWKRQPNARFLTAQRSARKRNLPFTLTKERYLDLIARPCFYCDDYFPRVECAIGLDRIDNNRGYELDNVLSCCATCNQTRNDNFSVLETQRMIQMIIKIRGKHEKN